MSSLKLLIYAISAEIASLLWIVGLTLVIAPIALKAFDARTRD